MTPAFPGVRELTIRYLPASSRGPRPQVHRPADAARLLQARLECEPVEVCLLLLLDTKHHVLGVHELSRGTLDSCPVHPRGVFAMALLAHAAAVVVSHNHPSGDPTPSPDDVALCARLRLAADLLDFLIVGDGQYYSFREAGR